MREHGADRLPVPVRRLLPERRRAAAEDVLRRSGRRADEGVQVVDAQALRTDAARGEVEAPRVDDVAVVRLAVDLVGPERPQELRIGGVRDVEELGPVGAGVRRQCRVRPAGPVEDGDVAAVEHRGVRRRVRAETGGVLAEEDGIGRVRQVVDAHPVPVRAEIQASRLDCDMSAGEAVVAADVLDVLARRQPRGRQLAECEDRDDRVLALVCAAGARDAEQDGGDGERGCETSFHAFPPVRGDLTPGSYLVGIARKQAENRLTSRSAGRPPVVLQLARTGSYAGR
jgi:hypothetical protein